MDWIFCIIIMSLTLKVRKCNARVNCCVLLGLWWIYESCLGWCWRSTPEDQEKKTPWYVLGITENKYVLKSVQNTYVIFCEVKSKSVGVTCGVFKEKKKKRKWLNYYSGYSSGLNLHCVLLNLNFDYLVHELVGYVCSFLKETFI